MGQAVLLCYLKMQPPQPLAAAILLSQQPSTPKQTVHQQKDCSLLKAKRMVNIFW